MDEQCVLCGIGAAVRVGGTSFCASCGLNQYSASAASPGKIKRRSRRTAFFALFSSGILAKTLLGAVALAAVGGAAASTVLQVEEPVAATTAAVAPATTQAEAEVIVEPTDSAPDDSALGSDETVLHEDAVVAFVAATQAWSDCVSEAASAHSGGAFNPHEACPDKPRPGDFGINVPDPDDEGPGNSEDAPGHDVEGPGNSENAPGHDVEGPGNSENAPGQDDDGPGNSEDAPGQDKDKDKDKDKDE